MKVDPLILQVVLAVIKTLHHHGQPKDVAQRAAWQSGRAVMSDLNEIQALSVAQLAADQFYDNKEGENT